MENRIELISPEILDKHPALSSELIQMGKFLALSSGWHYPLDWTWVASLLGEVNHKNILDAGAGIGLLQWYLASKGANLISVDRSDRTCIPFHLVQKFNITGIRAEDKPLLFSEIMNFANRKASVPKRLKAIARGIAGSLKNFQLNPHRTGSVSFLNKDMKDLSEIPDNSMDIVISISALEHNEHISDVKNIILELEKKLHPGGIMLITLPASQKGDWFFSPAYSWCFTEETLLELFDFEWNVSSNFGDYDSILSKLVRSEALKKNISLRYYFQPNSGMPRGKWNPQYLPVGIVKTKQAQNR